MGISCAPSIFRKIKKPVFAVLHQMGFQSTSYIDDSLLVGDSKDECISNVTETVSLMKKLGYVINWKNSVLEPSQVIQYLGNIINATDMTVTLPLEKKICIEDTCRKIKEEEFISVRSLASLIGLLVSSFGPLHYRLLEKEKVRSLKMHKGNLDGQMRESSIGVILI